VIDSSLENIPMVGIAANRLCSLIPLSEIEACKVELCVVEALNNSIVHACENREGYDVETVFTVFFDRLVVQVCDRGNPMDPKTVLGRVLFPPDPDGLEIEDVPENGRGLGIIKSIMDSVEYRTESGKNCLTMTKEIRTDDPRSQADGNSNRDR
jgi:serine/threonine-protein kinase RsbW